ncbi:n-alkane-inducible cytochrome P450 protein [Rutstroemia sp. NJR-2017a BBW]|nr:n-alkane-inducible cytochrome P450 protein [Rutstroemia sp. NJR-2017a BBW]
MTFVQKLGAFIAFVYIARLIYRRVSRGVRDNQADAALSLRHGTKLPPELTKRWPLGIDRIVELWRANADGHLLEFLCSIAKEYDHEDGNSGCQHLLIGPRAFYVLHPQNVETLLSTNFKDYGFGSRPAVFAPLLGKGIFTQEGEAWRHSRELLRKQFVRVQYQNLDHFREHVDNLVSCLLTKKPIDLQPLFFNLTLDTTTALLFGRSVYKGLAKRFRLTPFHFIYNPGRFRRACQKVHRFVERYIQQSKQQTGNTARDQSSWFLDQLVEGSRTDAEIRDQLLNVLLAGRDTTACCLSWTFRLLVRHPNVMKRLRQEIRSIMNEDGLPTREQLRKMPFLACVVKEVLRLYPPVPLNNREAIRTTILPIGGGPTGKSPIMVRKGELVVISPYVNARMTNLYGEDADSFRPERWETGELSHIGWAYFPFHGGPRQCLGEDFALMEIYYTTVRLLQTFPKICLPEGEIVEPVGKERQRLTLVLSSADGCRVSLSQSTVALAP